MGTSFLSSLIRVNWREVKKKWTLMRSIFTDSFVGGDVCLCADPRHAAVTADMPLVANFGEAFMRTSARTDDAEIRNELLFIVVIFPDKHSPKEAR
jgi:hypothetical protein